MPTSTKPSHKYLKNMHKIQIDGDDEDNFHRFRPSDSQERESQRQLLGDDFQDVNQSAAITGSMVINDTDMTFEMVTAGNSARDNNLSIAENSSHPYDDRQLLNFK